MLKKSVTQSGSWIAYSVLFLSSLLYGLNVITASIVSPLIPPLALSVLRCILGILVLLPFAWKQLVGGARPTRRELGFMVLLGLFGIALSVAKMPTQVIKAAP